MLGPRGRVVVVVLVDGAGCVVVVVLALGSKVVVSKFASCAMKYFTKASPSVSPRPPGSGAGAAVPYHQVASPRIVPEAVECVGDRCKAGERGQRANDLLPLFVIGLDMCAGWYVVDSRRDDDKVAALP